MGSPGRNLTPPKRGKITGWTPAAVRRHTRWLYGIEAPALTGHGYALSLTVKDTPPDAIAWHRARRAWIERLRYRGLVRLHWVVEWQRRGTPHLHCAVYFAHELDAAERWQLLSDWLDVAAPYRPGWRSQDVKPIDGPLGWLQYLSKHAARGVQHYQRNGKPPGWESTGRLWGYVGQWPASEPIQVDLTPAQAHRFRRLVRSWRVADARAAQDWRRVRYARRMLRCTDPALSAVRGVSEWIPEHVAVRLLHVAVEG
jgi:hypothetical protein